MANVETTIKVNIETLFEGKPIELQFIRDAIREKIEREQCVKEKEPRKKIYLFGGKEYAEDEIPEELYRSYEWIDVTTQGAACSEQIFITGLKNEQTLC